MSYRLPSALFLCTAAATALVLGKPLATVVAGLSIIALVIGLYEKKAFPAMVAGWLLYLPLGFAFRELFPDSWSYLASGLFVIVISEWLAFDFEAAEVLGPSRSIDEGTRTLLSRLSRAHRSKLFTYGAIAFGLMVVSSLASGLTAYASELVSAAILLMLVMVMYATR